MPERMWPYDSFDMVTKIMDTIRTGDSSGLYGHILQILANSILPGAPVSNRSNTGQDESAREAMKQLFLENVGQLASNTPVLPAPPASIEESRGQEPMPVSSAELPEQLSASAEEAADSTSDAGLTGIPGYSEEVPSEDTVYREDVRQKAPEVQNPGTQYSSGIRRTVEIKPEVYLTNSLVIIRMLLPEASRFKVHVGSGYAVIRLDQLQVEQIIALPPDIREEAAVAEISDSFLELRIPRMGNKESRSVPIDLLSPM